MKIAFDAQPLLSGTKSGVGFHEDGLIKVLLERYPENWYNFEFFAFKNWKEKKQSLSAYGNHNTDLVACKWFPGSLYRITSAFLPLPHRIFFNEEKQVTHFFNYFVPPFVKGKKVVTIHDMAFQVFPETVRKKTLFFLKRTIKNSIRRADHIVTVSEFSKQEIMRFYKVPEKKISVVPNGVDFERFHLKNSVHNLKQVREKYNIQGDYFLYLGTLEPRKNLVRLLLAYAMANGENKGFPRLVLAGGKGWMYEEIFQKVKELGLEGQVIFTGYVEDEDVAALMRGADVFCFPSLYEGFGMPVIEAMACGTPVLTSNSSSLREIAEGAAVLVDETSVDEIKKGLIMLHKEEMLRLELSQKGVQRASEYSWEQAGERLRKIYMELVKE